MEYAVQAFKVLKNLVHAWANARGPKVVIRQRNRIWQSKTEQKINIQFLELSRLPRPARNFLKL